MLEEAQVLDLSVVLPGSYASLLLADLGADVVKIERPPDGELTRSWEPTVDGVGYRFLVRNRNKRSICLDLKTDRGVELFHELAADADVILEGFRPGVADRLGIGYDDVRAVNEDIVYCSITGFGQDGPNVDLPGHDLNYASTAGLLGATRADDKPVVLGYPIADLSAGMFSALSILAALTQRDSYGGQHLDVSITDVVTSWSIVHAGEHFGTGGEYDPQDAVLVGTYPCYNVYETADETYLSVGAVEEKFWEEFCRIIGLEDLVDDHMAETGRVERTAEVQRVIRDRTRSEWLDTFADADVPVTPVNSLAEALESPQAHARGLVRTMDFGGTPIQQIASPFRFSEFDTEMRKAPPRLGEDTDTVLAELGYDDDAIATLIERDVLHRPDR